MMARTRAPARAPVRRKGDLAEYARKRDFARTEEPRAKAGARRKRALRFVIQKHAATRLHYDLRLELDGVMKSWAVPKGPSRDPAEKRLAVHVEDHPIEYNKFEGTIPQGEYGGGEVIIWDRGTYEPEDRDVDAFRRGLEKGRLTFTLRGERLEGTWSLIRMNRGDSRQWLLIKRSDEFVKPNDNLTAEDLPSIVSGRALRDIAGNGGKSNGKRVGRASPRSPRSSAIPSLSPMLASVGSDVSADDGWAFEPKYDGIRVLAFVDGDAASLLTRNNLDKATQFPEIADAVEALSTKRKRRFVLDGEIVARRGKELARFQDLQSRVGETNPAKIAAHVRERPATLVVFDILIDGDKVLVGAPWTTRRKGLERLLTGKLADALRLSESQIGDGKRFLERARRAGWEGIMAKRLASTYDVGKRSRDWVKIKLEARQEFIVGGWTDPRKSRQHLGALLLGYYDGDRFVYAGHTGTGFTQQQLAEMKKMLSPLERKTAPFDEVPDTNEVAHWVKPDVVVEVKFNEWTRDGRLRQPVFVGVRDDKDPRTVLRETASAPAKEKAKRQ